MAAAAFDADRLLRREGLFDALEGPGRGAAAAEDAAEGAAGAASPPFLLAAAVDAEEEEEEEEEDDDEDDEREVRFVRFVRLLARLAAVPEIWLASTSPSAARPERFFLLLLRRTGCFFDTSPSV